MPKKAQKVGALVLLSGGLDSMLAVRILQEQGIGVTGLSFVSCFFNSALAQKAADQLNIELRILDISKEHLEMVKRPRHGYGRAMNPCCDCHLMMLQKAAEIMGKEHYDFVATGDVLRQRMMSQKMSDLKLIEQESGLTGFLLRPLSAKLLEPTIVEQKGLVDREKLFDISGKSRKEQIALACKWKIKGYPSPAGGCLLTEIEFGQKLKELFAKWPDCDENNIKLLRFGRHFWAGKTWIVVGRNEKDNEQIQAFAQWGDVLIEPIDLPGATALIRKKNGYVNEKEIKKAKNLIIKYSAKIKQEKDLGYKFID